MRDENSVLAEPESVYADPVFRKSDLADRLCSFIDYWHYETFHGSLLADDAGLWTLVDRAKEDLKARILAQL